MNCPHENYFGECKNLKLMKTPEAYCKDPEDNDEPDEETSE